MNCKSWCMNQGCYCHQYMSCQNYGIDSQNHIIMTSYSWLYTFLFIPTMTWISYAVTLTEEHYQFARLTCLTINFFMYILKSTGHSSTTKVFQPAHLYRKLEFKILGYHFDHLYVNLSLICSYNLPYGTTQHTQANKNY